MLRVASTIFLLILSLTAIPADADSFAEHFAAADPAKPVPPIMFEDSKGQSLRLEDFHGRAVLLNLWAAWCSPCVAEMPTLDALQNMIGADKLSIIALDEERNASPDVTASFFKRHSIHNLVVYHDPTGRLPTLLQARGMPTTILFNADGARIGTVEGGVDWSAPDVVEFVRQYAVKR